MSPIKDGELTQFRMASNYGNVGLLAHNHLSGKLFSDIAVGQEIRLVYGDGSVEYFVVTEVLRYQALQPNSPWSNFRDLETDDKAYPPSKCSNVSTLATVTSPSKPASNKTAN